ncbi:MAG: putative Ig domain-containing protein [Thermodesulfovibrionales bacterium]
MESQGSSVIEDKSVSMTAPTQTNTVLYSLEIIPTDAIRNSTIYASPKGFSIHDTEIEWAVNGKPFISNRMGQFHTTELKKGDLVQAKATIHGKEILSNIIQIKNSPPEVQEIKIVQVPSKSGYTLSAEVSGADIDNDNITFTYEWTINGNQSGKDKQINGPLKRGDRVTVKVTPFDGDVYGESAMISSIMHNMPPIIIKDNKFNFDQRVYTRHIRATDPDGDTLTYTLKKFPAGMVIDKSTGLITWKVSEKDAGTHTVTVSVTDGHGGEALYNFEVTIGVEGR